MQEKNYILERMHAGLEKSGIPKRGRNPLVAKKTGYSPGMVAKLLSGHAAIGDRFIQAVCSAFDIRVEWIQEGKEPVLEQRKSMVWDPSEDEIERIDTEVFGLPPVIQERINQVQNDITKFKRCILSVVEILHVDDLEKTATFVMNLLENDTDSYGVLKNQKKSK